VDEKRKRREQKRGRTSKTKINHNNELLDLKGKKRKAGA